ncbi:MurR/RpiR family transcriptional regulator [Lactobacillus hamsteri]|uniref:Transcriptional regulator n=1 Tax=Lactobacillus hamsteri DSM 5661 = JCM 6256 TaxID=1423754 RepID=A0A0R1YEP7_9LACO|nr:MurR/RpiR family transcriptional regulator [Lactobacillus hamsteri]KRM40818.1 transcriptional regulator [Lactobacillus hamsteri DSM 5661 = JCM 6256]
MHNIFSIINGKRSQLPKKEQLLGDYIIANPKNVISSSIQKLSKDTGISTATIVRFCQEIGTNGFSDLKLQLVATQSSLNNVDYHEFDAGEGITAIKNTMVTRFKSVIEATQIGLNDRDIKKAVQKIGNSSRILVYGVAASGLVASDMNQKFMRIGKNINYISDFHVTLAQLASFTSDDLLILISNDSETTEIIELQKIADKFGIPTILLTANPRSSLAKKVDLVLLTQDVGEPTIRSGATTSLISQLFVVDVLVFSYVSTHSDKVIKNLKRSNEATAIHKNKSK